MRLSGRCLNLPGTNLRTLKKVDKKYAPGPLTFVICGRFRLEDGRFDYIIFNQVMEHLPEPKLVLDRGCIAC